MRPRAVCSVTPNGFLSLWENPITHLSSILGSYSFRTAITRSSQNSYAPMARLEVTESPSLYAALLSTFGIWSCTLPWLTQKACCGQSIPRLHPLNCCGANVPWCHYYINLNVLFRRSVTTWLLQEGFPAASVWCHTKAPAFLKPLRDRPVPPSTVPRSPHPQTKRWSRNSPGDENQSESIHRPHSNCWECLGTSSPQKCLT